MQKKEYLLKTLVILVSLYLMTFSISIYYYLDLGSDPVSVMVDGMTKVLQITHGQASNILNFSLIVFVFFLSKKYIHIGTVLSVCLYGVLIDWNRAIVFQFFERWEVLPVVVVAILLLLACAINGMALGLYLSMNLGASPFDGLVLIIQERLHFSYKISMYIVNTTFLVIGAILGGTWGIGTAVAILTVGYVFDFSLRRFRTLVVKYQQ